MIDITYEQIKELLKIEDLFEPVKRAFIDYNSSSLIGVPVSLLHFPNNADTHIKTAAIKGYDYFSIKVVSMFPDNAKQNLSPYSGAIFLFDGKTGFPAAILNDKGFITDLRTAAAGAIITDFVASKSSTSVAVIGTGIQAYYQVFALAKLRQINKLAIYGRSKEKALSLKKKLTHSYPGLNVNLVDSAENAVKESEIIITTTSSKRPLVKGKWLQKGQHVTAVGSDDVYKNEIDSDCFNFADNIFIDSFELNKKYGELSHAIESKPNLIDKTIEFGAAFQNKAFQNSENKITVAKLVGVGIQDLAASVVVMNKLKKFH
ncbi:ornithine cyclodeaminase [Tenacibaculum sp. MAR_2009_124]|uniref:ornithine cyclodeaminase family protein n=1 Tax=Tenacibaculum sp. MAR_2009_124 TaxID=1250059 RepID=UPI00089605E9|nr:ornithine cyclodeaminase family protein [Tenacibaculum sp. MAR_2009_124]SEB87140.1 ornithine cyclodeaminase [Tenacibaculum sp. MAR_2009_124]